MFEPVGRNTAPAIALACHLLLLEGRGLEVAGSFHSDHLIEDEETFLRAVRLAARCAAAGQVATIGLWPHEASTALGYVEIGDEVFAREDGAEHGGGEDGGAKDGGGEALTAYHVRGFREKPDAATARRFVDSGRFVWNAGMFLFRVDVMAGHFERLLPATWSAVRRIEPDLSNLAEVYAEIEPESIDVGIMERLDAQVSVPCDIGWSDVGSWDEVARYRPSAQEVVEVDGGNNFVYAHGDKVYALVGVDDLLVVDTADALLVVRRGATQGVKEVVGRLREAGRSEGVDHSFEVRPWGEFEVLRDTDRFKSKILRVDPGHQLSYQSHRHRSEHWVVVAGRPEVVLDGDVHALAPGAHIHIPQGARHRIRNPGGEPVEIVEVQLGDYFGEDDIVRYEDDYERS